MSWIISILSMLMAVPKFLGEIGGIIKTISGKFKRSAAEQRRIQKDEEIDRRFKDLSNKHNSDGV